MNWMLSRAKPILFWVAAVNFVIAFFGPMILVGQDGTNSGISKGYLIITALTNGFGAAAIPFAAAALLHAIERRGEGR